jgi:hypothetical protein
MQLVRLLKSRPNSALFAALGSLICSSWTRWMAHIAPSRLGHGYCPVFGYGPKIIRWTNENLQLIIPPYVQGNFSRRLSRPLW